jgi:hypothetical protein
VQAVGAAAFAGLATFLTEMRLRAAQTFCGACKMKFFRKCDKKSQSPKIH